MLLSTLLKSGDADKHTPRMFINKPLRGKNSPGYRNHLIISTWVILHKARVTYFPFSYSSILSPSFGFWGWGMTLACYSSSPLTLHKTSIKEAWNIKYGQSKLPAMFMYFMCILFYPVLMLIFLVGWHPPFI